MQLWGLALGGGLCQISFCSLIRKGDAERPRTRRDTLISMYGRDMDKILGCAGGRRSSGINIKPASNLWHAHKLAEVVGYPLTHHATINLEQIGCSPSMVSERLRHCIINPFRKWVTRPSQRENRHFCEATYAWTLENVPPVGVHVHMMLHLPHGSEQGFEQRLRLWIEDACGRPAVGNEMHIGALSNHGSFSRYLLKGGHKAVSAFFGAEHVPQGTIIGKRSGTSQNVGAHAKRRLRALGSYPTAQRRFIGQSDPALRVSI